MCRVSGLEPFGMEVGKLRASAGWDLSIQGCTSSWMAPERCSLCRAYETAEG